MSAHIKKCRIPFRARNGTRTRDPDLGKVVLYQLSYSRIKISNTQRLPGGTNLSKLEEFSSANKS